MALLKRLKGSTLMETMVATVLIVVIFMISSLILNNLFAKSIKENTSPVTERMEELKYQLKNEILSIPHAEEFAGWEIVIPEPDLNGMVVIMAVHRGLKKELTTHIIYEDSLWKN